MPVSGLFTQFVLPDNHRNFALSHRVVVLESQQGSWLLDKMTRSLVSNGLMQERPLPLLLLQSAKDLVRNNFPVWAADASPLAALVLT